MGLVPDVYDEATLGQELQGNRAIGHLRYSTSGVSVRKNAQPRVVRVCGIEIALAHNGDVDKRQEADQYSSVYRWVLSLEGGSIPIYKMCIRDRRTAMRTETPAET